MVIRLCGSWREISKEFCDALTLSGSKVENYTIEGSEISNVVVGKCFRWNGNPIPIICGSYRWTSAKKNRCRSSPVRKTWFRALWFRLRKTAPPCRAASKSKKGKLRGVVSNGDDVRVGKNWVLTAHDFPYAIEDGIFLIEEDCKVGQDIQSAIGLNDCSVEFEITSNRPDCLSVLGLARETAATFGIPMKEHTPNVKGCGRRRQRLSESIDRSARPLPALHGAHCQKRQDRSFPALDA